MKKLTIVKILFIFTVFSMLNACCVQSIKKTSKETKSINKPTIILPSEPHKSYKEYFPFNIILV